MNTIKRLRLWRGLSQKELADALGVSAQQLNNYENGNRGLGPKMLPLVADALGVSAAYLRGDAQKLAVYDWKACEDMALPIVSETVIDEYGIFYLVEHPDIGIIAVILSDGIQFTPLDWEGKQPKNVEGVAIVRWTDNRGDEAIMYKGLPRFVGSVFGNG